MISTAVLFTEKTLEKNKISRLGHRNKNTNEVYINRTYLFYRGYTNNKFPRHSPNLFFDLIIELPNVLIFKTEKSFEQRIITFYFICFLPRW